MKNLITLIFLISVSSPFYFCKTKPKEMKMVLIFQIGEVKVIGEGWKVK
ncbi:MAG: hypothetical protein K8R21_15570 [Leptospira sp.]|nr:hypothetical protein [Leptospira sp.]